MKLSRYTLKIVSPENATVPDEDIFTLPEKVLQFGTGMLLRGLPDYYIDNANRQGVFNGRIVVVKSTSKGDTSDYEKQDGLYTICERGILNGEKIKNNIISSSISRVLNAKDEWEEILECAHNEELQVIISNTTEMGIQLVKDDIRRNPPSSFPGKLLAFLYERFIAFGGSKESGLVIIPTELLPDNGEKLESIVMELAHLNSMNDNFIEWLEGSNHFCSSLVDRIVTGTPGAEEKKILFEELGYIDELLTVTEVYNLWAIQGNDFVKEKLSFCQVNEGVKIEPDINTFRELKLRLLNGTHTISSGIAVLAGVDTVKDATDNESMSVYIRQIMEDEFGPSIPYEISPTVIESFINDVINRFKNPHIQHYWKSIAQNYSKKMKLRCMPLLMNYVEKNEAPPPLFSFGFAAYIFYMKGEKQVDEKYYGLLNGVEYFIDDEMAAFYFKLWQQYPLEKIVKEVLRNEGMWGNDLNSLSGFYDAVLKNLNDILAHGTKASLENILSIKYK